MTDFSTVLRRAIGNLPDNTVEARRQLYARAETALVAQLKKAEPPADEARIAQMRDNLRTAARQIEAEQSGQRPRAAQPAAPAPQAPKPPQASPAKPPVQGPAAPPAGDKPAAGPARPPVPGSPGYVSPLRQRREMSDAAGTATAAAGVAVAGAPAPASAPAYDESVDAGYDGTAGELADEEAYEEAAYPADPAAPEPQPAFDDWPEPGAYELEPRRRPWGLIVTVLVLAILAGLGYWQREALVQAAQPLLALIQPKGGDDPKVDVRLSDDDTQQGDQSQAGNSGQPGQPADTPPATVPGDAPVEALLVEEGDTPQSAPTEVPGKVTWTLQREDGMPVIEGRVQVPSRDFGLSLTIRKNTDPSFPATHTIDFVFTVPPDFGGGGINNVPGLLIKSTPKARGGPLAGEVVRVDEGIFLMALLAGELDAPRNLQALSTQPFLDVPMVYANGQRAIVTIAKGPEGENVFAQAFAEWGTQ